MVNVITDIEGDQVTISAIPGEREAFAEAAGALAAAGGVTTVTGPTGVALRASLDTAKKAGIVKRTTRTTKKG